MLALRHNSIVLMSDPLPIWSRILAWFRRAGREIWLFVSSGIFLKNAGAMLGVLLLAFLLVNFALRSYTRHGDSVTVGNYVDMTVSDSREAAERQQLRIQVLDSVWTGPQTEQLVLEQSPRAASEVKADRTIYLTVTKVQAPEVLLPQFKDYGYDYVRYAQTLEGLDIKATILKEVFDPKQAPGTILYFNNRGKKYTDADLAEGIKLPKGAELSFVITEKESNVILPDVVCRTYDEARFILESSGLRIGSLNGSDSPFAYVFQQRPHAASGRTARSGSAVDLFLSDERPAACR